MNIDAHLLVAARNFAATLERELDNSRKSHYEDAEALRSELEQTKKELRESNRKLRNFLNHDDSCESTKPHKADSPDPREFRS